MAEIAVLRTHIVNYAKTREVYVAYRKEGYSKKFREEDVYKRQACPVCATDKSKCTGKAPEPPAETSEPEKEKPAGLNPAAIVLLLALLGGGGVVNVIKLK